MPQPSHPSKQRINSLNVGLLGEAVTAQWLKAQGWEILHQRWRCTWGELDLIARTPESEAGIFLVFVEVKTRRPDNWDDDGLLAITPKKQAKLWKAAEAFLATYPQWSELACRFDVVLVSCQPIKGQDTGEGYGGRSGGDFSGKGHLEVCLREDRALTQSTFSEPMILEGYELRVRDHICSAFGG